MGDEGVKVTGIRQMVRFREMLQKWNSMALRPKETEYKASGIPPAVDKRLKNACISCDSDEEGCCSPEPPPDVPKGCIPIYVGPEHRRFVVPASYLSHPAFKLLLEKAEEEFGFEHRGAITIPCEIETFKCILQCMKRHQKGLINGVKSIASLL